MLAFLFLLLLEYEELKINQISLNKWLLSKYQHF